MFCQGLEAKLFRDQVDNATIIKSASLTHAMLANLAHTRKDMHRRDVRCALTNTVPTSFPAMFICNVNLTTETSTAFCPLFHIKPFLFILPFLPDNRNFIHQTSQKFLPCSFSEWKLFPCLLFSFVASAEDEVYYCNLFSFIPLEKNFTTFCT